MLPTGILIPISKEGRITIPKEIKNTLDIVEGDELELFMGNNGQLIMKKISNDGFTVVCNKCGSHNANVVNGNFKCNVCDNEVII